MPNGQVPPTTAGLAIPTPAAVAEHAQPEMPRTGRHIATTPAELEARQGDPRLTLELRLRYVTDLIDAIREIRNHLIVTKDPDEAAQVARLDRAERLYRVHYLDYLQALRALVRAHAVAAFRLAEMSEFARALESQDFAVLLEAHR